ncbi:tRNA (adenosine(37)-N6)-threonylcarbamoyltransferase complex ATPase subunit type 1 TsaE [bacterium]|nr:tRNA (adenosine(37)-N6)-threonylcarbamoyltransferase complex ATPase subunit type 1 TsaE [bacterium]
MTITKTADETSALAGKLAEELIGKKNAVICLKGNLGTGKTTFVKGFCEYFGVKDSNVKSPTYTYYRLYKGNGRDIFHFDYYRLVNFDEQVENELLEIIEKENTIVLIEWPEKAEYVLPKGTVIVDFAYGDDKNERIINFSKL